MSANKPPVVSMRKLMHELSYKVRNSDSYDEFITKYKVKGVMDLGHGRNILRFIPIEEYDRVLAEYKKAEAEKPEDHQDPQVHIGALETKMDRMEAMLKEINQSLSLIVKAGNLHSEQVSLMLKELGVKTS